MQVNILSMEHITKSFSDRILLDDIGFGLQEGEKVGVIGINGMGKSTLLKLIAGIEQPDDGEITKGKNIRIGYLSQTPVFEKDETLLGLVSKRNPKTPEEFTKESEAKAMLAALGFTEFNQKLSELSGGQRKRAVLVETLLNPVDILILDEPTNHLDDQMSQWLEDRLIGYRGTLIMVTHDRYFLDRVATRIVEVDRGSLYSYPGSYSKYLEQKAQRLDIEQASERKRQSILTTELKWLARGARARSTKQKAHIQRIEDMQNVKTPVLDEKLTLSSVSSRLGNTTIEAEHLAKSYGGKLLFTDYSHIFLKDERVGITGPNGCGKTTLLKIIHGDIEPDHGLVTVGATVKIGYFAQEYAPMNDDLKAIEYVREGAEYIQTKEGKITASAMMERFLFDSTMQWTRIEKLSGGEKRRLYLLRILMDAPNVLILDEPTNDLDIPTLNVLEDYLDNFDGIVIVVSHDRYFLDRVVQRILAFEEEGKIRQYEGGYSDYLIANADRRQQDERSVGKSLSESEETSIRKKSTEKPRHNQKLKFTFKEQREFETIDTEISSLEEHITKTEDQIQNAATDFVKLNELSEKKEKLEKELEEKTERWIYLTDLDEKIKAQSSK
ncbi:ABC-F family ATP-binding cassette domain-containing protein [Blautia liquoris]|nr:ABC-F family ATP-binding cassette domain-containing protein [Blautia liquoris]